MIKDTYDFICIGGGLGGLAAAIVTFDAGLDTLILEKSAKVGGVAAYSGGFIWAPDNHLQRERGISDSLEEGMNYLEAVSGEADAGDLDLRRTLLETLPQAIEYYTWDAGVPFQIIEAVPDQYWPEASGSKPNGRNLEVVFPGTELGDWQDRVLVTPHYSAFGYSHAELAAIGGRIAATHPEHQQELRKRADEDIRTHGSGLAAAFVKAALVDREVDCITGARVVRLLYEDGVIAGVVADVEGTEMMIHSRSGVLIATGSYGNAPYAASTEGLPDLEESGPPVQDGDSLPLTDPTPAALVRAGGAVTTVGFHVPGEKHDGGDEPLFRQVFDSIAFPHSMIVNRDGRRFGDESFYALMITAMRSFDDRAKRYPNYPCWLIVDDRFRIKYPIASFAPGSRWPDEIPRADDLRTLATEIGVDGDGLEETVTHFNVWAEKGEDPDFRRGSLPYSHVWGDPEQQPNPNLGPVEQPPFWALRLQIVGAGVYSMGLAIDEHARVLTRDRDPVPGLYATGNAVAYLEQPGYFGGLSNGRNIAYAFLAASHAAGAATVST